MYSEQLKLARTLREKLQDNIVLVAAQQFGKYSVKRSGTNNNDLAVGFGMALLELEEQALLQFEC